MANVAFPHYTKSRTLSTSHTYGYVYIRHSGSFPTLLFLHGFPSSCYDWRHQITFFSKRGCGILAPDLLGYGATDKPESLECYRAKTMSAEIVEILDHENISKVHAIGHDMDCGLLSRLANYFPDRLLTCSFLTVPYSKPGERFDLRAINEMTKTLMGFERFGYIEFFIGKTSGAIIDKHIDSFFSLFYAQEPELWKEHLASRGAIQNWLRADMKGPLASYITETEKETHCRILKGNYQKATNWYRALESNINVQDDIHAQLNPKLTMPILMVTAKPSAISVTGFAGMMNQFSDNITFKEVSTIGHWVQLEAADEVNQFLDDFIFSDCVASSLVAA